jgi:hypothetical protein
MVCIRTILLHVGEITVARQVLRVTDSDTVQDELERIVTHSGTAAASRRGAHQSAQQQRRPVHGAGTHTTLRNPSLRRTLQLELGLQTSVTCEGRLADYHCHPAGSADRGSNTVDFVLVYVWPM